MADDAGQDAGPNEWYEESWAVVTAGVAGVLAIGILIYAVVQTAQNAVDPSEGPQYFTGYPSTTMPSTTMPSTTTRTTTTTRTSTTTTTTTTTTSTGTTRGIDDDNPFILNPFDTSTSTDAGQSTVAD